MGIKKMSTISLTVPEEEFSILKSYAKIHNKSLSEIIRITMLDHIENEYGLRVFAEYEEEKATGTVKTRPIRLLADIDRNGYQCIGKPEPLKGNLAGYWSVRIDDKNRIVFKIENNNFEIIQCGSHMAISKFYSMDFELSRKRDKALIISRLYSIRKTPWELKKK